MNQDLSMYRPAAFSIIYGLENTILASTGEVFLSTLGEKPPGVGYSKCRGFTHNQFHFAFRLQGLGDL